MLASTPLGGARDGDRVIQRPLLHARAARAVAGAPIAELVEAGRGAGRGRAVAELAQAARRGARAAAALGDVPGGDGDSDEDAYDEEQSFPMLQSCFCGAFDYDLVDLSTIYEDGEPHEDGATVDA